MHIQSDTLLPADLSENFRNKCIEIYEPDPAHFLSVPALAWQACLKKREVQLDLFTNIDMLLMVEKGIWVEYVMQYIDMLKQVISTWKIMIKTLNHHISSI